MNNFKKINDREFQIFLIASKAAIDIVTNTKNADPFLERRLIKFLYQDEKYNYACNYFFKIIKEMYKYIEDEKNE